MPFIVVDDEALDEFNLIVKPQIALICKNVEENNRFAEIRDSLLPLLMSGELDVSAITV